MKLFKPKNSVGKHNHCNDTFRELVDIWKELNLIEVIETETNFVWLESIGKILLYDRPTLEWLDHDYEIGLFGNPDLPKNDKINLPWIFWGRNPRLLMQEYSNPRIYNTIFIGKIENQVQHHNHQKSLENKRNLCNAPILQLSEKLKNGTFF